MIKKYVLEYLDDGAKANIQFLSSEERDEFILTKNITDYDLSEFEDVDANLEP